MPTVSIDRQIPGWLIDTSKLRALAADVTCWSNCNQAWVDNSEDQPAAVVGHIDEDGNTYPVATIDCDQYYAAQDSIKLARFYAAANPTTILSLLDLVDAQSAAIARIRASIERTSQPCQPLADSDAIRSAAELACGLLWMTAEWRTGKTEAAYQALLEAVGGSGSQGLRESIEAALAAGHEVDAPPGCYWPEP